MSKKSSELSAKESIKKIESIDNVDDLNAHVDDAEDRSSVLKATDKRFAELTEAVEAEAEAPEAETTEPTEEVTEEVNEDVDTEVTVEVDVDVAEVVSAKIAAEKEFKGANVDATTTALSEALESFLRDTTESKFKVLRKAIANQVNADKQRRGMTQPTPVDKALLDLHTNLSS